MAILWGGLACGVLDITQAMVAWGIQFGTKPTRILQSVAAGLIGRDAAVQGGLRTAALGAVLHFFIAFTVAAVYYTASRWIPFLTKHAVLAGLLYGEAVFLFMHFVVLPLSAVPKGGGPMTMALLITGPIGHTVLVGLPVALIVRRYSNG
jgi:uncharacterized membrane protein YagU involved in acid resistance